MHRNSAKHILGVVHPFGGYDPQIRTLPKFFYNAPTPKFHHPVFTCSEVVVLTNTHKQTDPGEKIQRSLLCYDVG